MKKKRYIIIYLCMFLLLNGCGNSMTEENSTEIESIVSSEEKTDVEVTEEELSLDVIEIGEEIEPEELQFFVGTYGRGMEVDNCDSEMIENYMELIDILSKSLKAGTIDDTLQSMDCQIEVLSEEEKEELFQKEAYKVFAHENKDFLHNKKRDWYIVEQTEQRVDIVMRYTYEGSDFYYYDIFKCNIKENGELDVSLGYPAISRTSENMFIEYKGLKYLCTFERNSEGNIQGIAVHIFEYRDYFGGPLYIEYMDEIDVKVYLLIDGDIGDPIPGYLIED